MKNKEKGK